MRLNVVFLPLLLIAIFGYSVNTAHRVSDGDLSKLTAKKFAAQVKEDFSPVTPLDYNKLNK